MLGHHCTYISSTPFYKFLLNILRNTRTLWSPALGQGWDMGKAEAVRDFKGQEIQSDVKVSETTFTELGQRHIIKRYSKLNMQRGGKGCSSALFWPFHKNILHWLDKSKNVKKIFWLWKVGLVSRGVAQCQQLPNHRVRDVSWWCDEPCPSGVGTQPGSPHRQSGGAVLLWERRGRARARQWQFTVKSLSLPHALPQPQPLLCTEPCYSHCRRLPLLLPPLLNIPLWILCETGHWPPKAFWLSALCCEQLFYCVKPFLVA